MSNSISPVSRASAGRVGHVDRVGDAAGALGQFGQRFGAAGEGVDLQPFAAEPLDHGRADAGRGAGDEGSLVVGEGHGTSCLG